MFILLFLLYACNKENTVNTNVTKLSVITSGTNQWLSSVFFTNNQIGYAVGSPSNIIETGDNGTILKTTNGGSTWLSLSIPQGAPYTLNSIYFIDSITGYMIGQDSKGQAAIFKTINGGSDWVILSSKISYELNSIYFTDANTGYAVGICYKTGNFIQSILKTTDAGNTWKDLSLPVSSGGAYYWINSVYFINSNIGFVVGNGIILKTINAGNTWSTVSLPSGIANDYIFSVYFTDADNGYAVGTDSTLYTGIILKTVNSGLSWTVLTFKTITEIYSVHFTNFNTGYAVGEFAVAGYGTGAILKTSDAGKTWSLLTNINYPIFSSIDFSNPNTGYAVGENGAILKLSEE